MINPPLYLRLTDCLDGEIKNILLNNIHVFHKHECDDPTCFAGSEVTTLLPAVNPRDGGLLTYSFLVKETPSQIEAKMRVVLRNYSKIAYGNAKKFNRESWQSSDDDDDEEPTLWA